MRSTRSSPWAAAQQVEVGTYLGETNRDTVLAVKVVIYGSARRHGVADAEIRTVVAHPIVRYGVVPRAEPEAKLIRLVGDTNGGPLIEVVADQVEPDELHVFHAMLLTVAVAREVFDATGGAVDLTDQVTRKQRTRLEET